VRFSREAGFAVHLTKPIDVGCLEAAIEQLVFRCLVRASVMRKRSASSLVRARVGTGTEALRPAGMVAERKASLVAAGAGMGVAFHRLLAKSRGTKDCVRRAIEAGIPRMRGCGEEGLARPRSGRRRPRPSARTTCAKR
jgi:hypothetical protein